MGVIDADAHVIETERTWSFMLEEDRRFAPELLVSSKNGVEYWRIDERVFPNSNLGLNVPEESRDLTDVSYDSLTWTHWASTSRFFIPRFFYGR